MKNSGQTDSQFMITQKMLQNKNSEYMKELYKEQEREVLLSRFQKVEVKNTNSLWQKIKGWFSE
jgi:hypothetical protein